MTEPYFDEQATPAARLGQKVYHDALSDRRGFRDDQVGIPTEDAVWSEIFEEIGQAVFAAGYVPASEVQRAREEALRLRLALSAARAALGCPDEVDGCDRHIYHEHMIDAIRAEIDAALATTGAASEGERT